LEELKGANLQLELRKNVQEEESQKRSLLESEIARLKTEIDELKA